MSTEPVEPTSEPALDPSDVRRQLEEIAARSRPTAQESSETRWRSGSPQPIVNIMSARAEAREDAEKRDARRRSIGQKAFDEEEELRRLATGDFLPVRLYHEKEGQFEERRAAWLATPDGAAALAKYRRRMQERQDESNALNWPSVVEKAALPSQFADLVKAGGLAGSDALLEVKRRGFEVLVLAGRVGTGKSVAAAWWLLHDYLPGGVGRGRALWVSAARLARWPRYEEDKMALLLTAGRLVIDDLGTEFADSKGNFLAILDEVVNDRLGNGRPMVITTNLEAEDFKARYGDRVVDRIREHGRFCSFAGESMRRKA